jgi:AraC-like DNA-binding protein
MKETVKNSTLRLDRIPFHRYPPDRRLAPFVRNFWTVRRCDVGGIAKRQRILPDGCIDVIFTRTSRTTDYRGYVVGTMTQPIFEELTGHVDYIGIRFAPGGFRRFFVAPPGELTDRIVPLEDLSISTASTGQLAEAGDVRTQLDILEHNLCRRFEPTAQDSAVDQILSAIGACDGNVTIAELARRTGWSPRHLRRRFTASVGVGPKTFCRIVRFKKAYRVLRRSARPNSLEAALEAGYYDQAHFIHEFNCFYGASPSAVAHDPCL